jgi:hypothetical protein
MPGGERFYDQSFGTQVDVDQQAASFFVTTEYGLRSHEWQVRVTKRSSRPQPTILAIPALPSSLTQPEEERIVSGIHAEVTRLLGEGTAVSSLQSAMSDIVRRLLAQEIGRR